jgi:hypothetical protein
MAILRRFAAYFITSDLQFGFKKKLSCNHAIYSIRNVVDHYIRQESTVNLCMIDLCKAFDKMNHYALFLKLLNRRFPIQLINIFVLWFNISATRIKWGGCLSHFFKLRSGVRQGGVLSPYFFAMFIDDVINEVATSKTGCHISLSSVAIFVYADDIVLVAPSIQSLQDLLSLVEGLLEDLDMRINATKSQCIRFGHRHDAECANLTARNGDNISWVKTCRYLGAYFVSGRTFKCSFDHAKRQFYRSFNAVYSKLGRFASEEVVLSLVRSKCLPTLLYAVESCSMNNRDKRSLEFTVNRIFMKIFRTGSMSVIEECQRSFGFLPTKLMIDIKVAKFLQKFLASENRICRLFCSQAGRQLGDIKRAYQLSSDSTACQISSEIHNRFFQFESM